MKVSFSDAWARVWIKHQLVAMHIPLKIHWRFIQFGFKCSHCGNRLNTLCVDRVAAGSGCGTEAGSGATFGCMEFWQTSRELRLLLRFCCVCTDWQVLAFGPYPRKPDPLSCTALHEMDLSSSYVYHLFFLWGSCLELLISWYVFFSNIKKHARKKSLLFDMRD